MPRNALGDLGGLGGCTCICSGSSADRFTPSSPTRGRPASAPRCHRPSAYCCNSVRTARRIAASASGVCACSAADVRTPPCNAASNNASPDGSRHTSGSVRTATAVKPARDSAPRLSSASLNRKNGGPSGRPTFVVPCVLHRAEDDAEADRLFRPRPDGERIAASRTPARGTLRGSPRRAAPDAAVRSS